MKKLLVNIIYIMEAILLCLWIIICRLIGIDIASKLGSIVFKFIGPMTKFDKRAANNISKIYNEWFNYYTTNHSFIKIYNYHFSYIFII